MPKFLYVYHGGSVPESEEEGKKVMQAWMDWMGSLGDAIIDGGNPVGMSKTVVPGGKVEANGGANPASGYSLINAADMDDALAKAKGCPILDAGGSVEVAETMDM
ncbi:hypothetical protein FQ775_05885 [Nitratireductor mangrovi]|uniref:YCII-related domain-containing protein n=1 Tax=Nitratireductor mangrovi TaxID=2599600 RepID=A0A5B8KWK9_9HYPH|nr:hypothetical protein [Nitratireductor mangrovi]QDY99941.1 hypothetical protein FQ775_05885 [Nitratireductor mangrovi]